MSYLNFHFFNIIKKYFSTIAVMLTIFMIAACTNPESSEGTEGPEGGDEGGNESGKLWAIADTADETINGIRLILAYNAANVAFEGTLENINTVVASQVRVEVHVYDAANVSTEYGPTTPADMNPGEMRNVVLPVPGAGTIVKFNMHPEVGSGGSEGGGS